MKRRDFIKCGIGGMTALSVGGVGIPGMMNCPDLFAQVPNRNFALEFTDAVKEMWSSTPNVPQNVYFWCFKAGALRVPSVPGPLLTVTAGQAFTLTLTNSLPDVHAFRIGAGALFDSGPINPGQTITTPPITINRPGTYLYFDPLNAPVNRVMGLHGGLIVMPAGATPGNKINPYGANATAAVRNLFNDLGTTGHFPGLAWDEGDPGSTPPTPRLRQWVWLCHGADPVLFDQVRVAMEGGATFDRVRFTRTYRPQFFTISGETGFFVHFNQTITPYGRVGEPGVIRVLNAGLWTHSLHIHGNHVYWLSTNGVVHDNLHWVDTWTMRPLETVDLLVPFHRPPDVPNAAGDGLPAAPLATINGGTTWPPREELLVRHHTRLGIDGTATPIRYPMHDHTEPTQTTTGGNYTQGLLGGLVFIGDRTLPGGIVDFDMGPGVL